ncbi:alpha/beta fold hydrolase [Bacterioplanoides sp.]|uniref:alpha/beta fold hydrolase n=1 Tax=Bacterioplanoides sp. TaxID=2066072 RepID=UPI003B0025BF
MNKQYLQDGNPDHPLILLAHGAGAGKNSDFMQHMAQQLAQQSLYVVRFDFPYMQKREQDGKKRPPDRAPKLLQAYQEVIQEFDRPCVVAGKSMGGRMATLLAAEQDQPLIKGCAALGYPFHPLGKPDNLRTEHLQVLSCPTLILQGMRDKMGSYDEVMKYELADDLAIQWLPDGDHDLKPRKASGFTHERNIQAAAQSLAEFSKAILR